MNARAEALRSELLALPEAERAGLIIDLLDSLDDRPVEEDSAELDRDLGGRDRSASRPDRFGSGEDGFLGRPDGEGGAGSPSSVTRSVRFHLTA